MTFETAAWAINGPTLGASLARRAEFAAVGGAEGIVSKGDLKVSQLAVPGVGILISAGVGLVSNRYQTAPNETYVVSNPSTHTVPSGSMPASSPSARSFFVAVVIGDPDFSQTGHPWMGAGDPPVGSEESFAYVRPTLIETTAGATTLSGSYPALLLARIDIPANTTTITNAMITDLRKLAQPRQSQEIFVSGSSTWDNASPRYIPTGTSYADWGPQEFPVSVKIPTWAKRAIVVTSVNGIRFKDTSVNLSGNIRTQLGSVSGAATKFDLEVDASGGARRMSLQAAGEYDVTTIAGQTVNVRVEGYQNTPASPTNDQRLRLQGGSQMIFDLRFFEE